MDPMIQLTKDQWSTVSFGNAGSSSVLRGCYVLIWIVRYKGQIIMRLDLTAMEYTKEAIRAVKIHPGAVEYFMKKGEKGPFVILLDINRMSVQDEADFIQITVDFNQDERPCKGELIDVLRIGQRGQANNLIPVSLLEGPNKNYNKKEIKNG